MVKRVFFGWAMLAACAVHVAAAQAVTDSLRYRYRLLGVYDADSGDPIEGADVIDVLSGTKGTTGKSGVLSLFFLPDGGSLVRIRKLGYELQTFSVSIARADTLPLTVVLKRATQLPTVVVNDSAPRARTATLRDFEERSRQGYGHFITTADLRKNENTSLGQIVPARIPGVNAVRKGGGTYLMATRKECQGRVFSGCVTPSCPVTVYQDGVVLPTPTDLSSLRTDDFAGVEFYAGGATMPPKYNRTDSGCGVLLLWTRID